MHRLKDEEIGKRTETYTFRMPENLHFHVIKMTPHWKRRLADALLITVAKVVHESEFDPMFYLKDD